MGTPLWVYDVMTDSDSLKQCTFLGISTTMRWENQKARILSIACRYSHAIIVISIMAMKF